MLPASIQGGRGRAVLLVSALAAALTAMQLAGTPAGAPAAQSCFGKRATIVSSKPKIIGTKAPDVIVVLGGGRHTVDGLGGNDRICGGPGDDRLIGDRGSDRIAGRGGDDMVLGGRGSDTLSGGPGTDYLDGQKGSDSVDGGPGDGDRVFGDKGNDSLYGGAGNGDYLDGGLGDEKIEDGGEGEGDIVIGNLGSDNLTGGPGDHDVVRGDGGNDTLDGGGGSQDIASFATAPSPGVVVDLAAGTATGDGHDTLREVDDVEGSPFDDRISGDQSANRLDGGPGNDTLEGGGSDADQGFGGPGADSCRAFVETSSCNDASPPQRQTAVELSRGLEGVSLVVAGLGADDHIILSYEGGAFVVSDSAGLEARPESGCSSSGAGRVSCPSGLGLSFALVDTGPGNDSFAVGGGIPASLQIRATGGNGDDVLEGGPGDDLLEAGDEYSGTSGHDTLSGGGGNDGLIADPGGDVLSGGDGNDLLVSSAAICQGHTFDGGNGLDTVSYARSKPPGKFVIALGKTGAPAGGCHGGTADTISSSNESLEGSEGNDVLIGDAGANTLFGHGGADTFLGGGGSDSVEAVDGQRDTEIDCGPGNDQGATRDPSDPKPKSC